MQIQKCKYIASVCNKRWNEDKYRRECKDLIEKGIYDNGLIGILTVVNVNVIKYVILENIQTIKNLSVEKGQLINKLKNVVKILMRRNYIQIK